MDKTTESLLRGFTELCEEIVSNAYVVTDGRAVVSTVIDHALAIKLCKHSKQRMPSHDWKVAKFADAIELAYRKGFTDCMKATKENLFGEEASNEDELSPTKNGDTDEENSELRERDIQQQEESS